MVTLEQYSDIQILQGTDLSHEIEFDETFNVQNYTWAAQIAKDNKATSFAWGGTTATVIGLTVARTNNQKLELTLAAVSTSKFPDDFEGVWELISKADTGSTVVRQIQGDVVVSPGIVDTSVSGNFTNVDVE